ncbi:MAG: hypothetical protein U0166_02650 [Acidobacteriota bacterium]
MAETPTAEPARLLEETATGALEPYEFERCTVHVSLTLHPDDGDPRGRLVSVTAWTHKAPPVIETLRHGDLGPLPEALQGVFAKLKDALGERERLARDRTRAEAERAAADEAKRKEEAARRRTPATPTASISAATTVAPSMAPATSAEGPQLRGPEQRSLFGSDEDNDPPMAEKEDGDGEGEV